MPMRVPSAMHAAGIAHGGVTLPVLQGRFEMPHRGGLFGGIGGGVVERQGAGRADLLGAVVAEPGATGEVM